LVTSAIIDLAAGGHLALGGEYAGDGRPPAEVARDPRPQVDGLVERRRRQVLDVQLGGDELARSASGTSCSSPSR
jgi:hypothetical protein